MKLTKANLITLLNKQAALHFPEVAPALIGIAFSVERLRLLMSKAKQK